MNTTTQNIQEYQKALQEGHLSDTYQFLMQTMRELRNEFQSAHPSGYTAGSMYTGEMDITFFTFTPDTLKALKLKVALVLQHKPMRFEIWLTGQNKSLHSKYWHIIKEKNWPKEDILASPEHGVLVHHLDTNPNFERTEVLKQQLKAKFISYTEKIEATLC